MIGHHLIIRSIPQQQVTKNFFGQRLCRRKSTGYDVPDANAPVNSKATHIRSGMELLATAEVVKGEGTNALGPAASQNVITIIILLENEMANYLSRFAYGYGVKWLLEEEYNITTRVILREDETNGRLVNKRESIKSCFPKLREMNFSEGNTPEFQDRWKQQQAWLGTDRFVLKSCTAHEICLPENLDELLFLLTQSSHPPPKVPLDANITLPFLFVKSYALFDFIIDRYYDRLVAFFEFDENNPVCCGPKAHFGETVFHARGFEKEMPMFVTMLGFDELSPNKTVKEILKDHHPGDKIAVLSRYPSFGQMYVDAMRSKGLDARLVETTNGEQSFCFLMSGRNEIIGVAKSTFTMWASYLGNASHARIYSMRTPGRIRLFGDRIHIFYNFTHPKLKERLSFELYDS
ncbi:hypothetical protein MHU86_19881 [Fragilaria crotonensis]|nr:hypothetical protein MHU86_19881 [Fragilaria crotonensis]